MTDDLSRFWKIFSEVFETLPRQGPGNKDSTKKALNLCDALPSFSRVLDLGCGVGAGTFHLANFLDGKITALDNHAPSIEKLKNSVMKKGLAEKIKPMVGDMANPGLPLHSFDLIWSEGALYQIGVKNSLGICFNLLTQGGYLIFTDAVWLKQNPPNEIKAIFDMDYPLMGQITDILDIIEKSQFTLIDHFTLPDEAWWNDFYTPLEKVIPEFKAKYASDKEILSILDQVAQEPCLHRKYSDYYAYEFFILRRV